MQEPINKINICHVLEMRVLKHFFDFNRRGLGYGNEGHDCEGPQCHWTIKGILNIDKNVISRARTEVQVLR
jgi:hypothetical protein